METNIPVRKNLWNSVIGWFDKHHLSERKTDEPNAADWIGMIPFILIHVSCLAVLWVGWSTTAVIVAVALYFIRMFAITAFYHRYFSHRTFKTSRWGQFLFAVLGNTAVQKGPLWWAAHHRDHHRYSDKDGDIHSPHRQGLYWSHVGWITSRANFRTKLENVKDLSQVSGIAFPRSV